MAATNTGTNTDGGDQSAAQTPATTAPGGVTRLQGPVKEVGAFDFLFDVRRMPCFRKSMLWGIGVGMAMGAHSMFNKRIPHRAADTAVKTWAVVATATWFICRSDFKKKRATTKAAMESNRLLADPNVMKILKEPGSDQGVQRGAADDEEVDA